MPGNREGGKKAAATNIERHGEDFYKKIGTKGGSVSHPDTRPFKTNPKLASEAGRKGGQLSKRGPSKNKTQRKKVAEPEKVVAQEQKKGVFRWLFSGRKSE